MKHHSHVRLTVGVHTLGHGTITRMPQRFAECIGPRFDRPGITTYIPAAFMFVRRKMSLNRFRNSISQVAAGIQISSSDRSQRL